MIVSYSSVSLFFEKWQNLSVYWDLCVQIYSIQFLHVKIVSIVWMEGKNGEETMYF